MEWAVITTWEMSLKGCGITAEALRHQENLDEAVMKGINDVEDNPEYHSVGFGGGPDREGHVRCDGGFMDGDTLHFGAVGSMEGFRSAVRVAHGLVKGDANNFLVGPGAEKFAAEHGFERRDNLTEESKKSWEEEVEKRKKPLSAYDGHDTVCFLGMQNGRCVAATSTSGLFMKEPGRVGDTPLPGNGFYADSEIGAAAGTGMGEEIMKGALSFAAVLYMKQGYTAQEAADKAVMTLDQSLKKRNGYAQPMSLIVMDKEGNFGVGTNIEFTFCTASSQSDPTLYKAMPSEEGAVITKA